MPRLTTLDILIIQFRFPFHPTLPDPPNSRIYASLPFISRSSVTLPPSCRVSGSRVRRRGAAESAENNVNEIQISSPTRGARLAANGELLSCPAPRTESTASPSTVSPTVDAAKTAGGSSRSRSGAILRSARFNQSSPLNGERRDRGRWEITRRRGGVRKRRKWEDLKVSRAHNAPRGSIVSPTRRFTSGSLLNNV